MTFFKQIKICFIGLGIVFLISCKEQHPDKKVISNLHRFIESKEIIFDNFSLLKNSIDTNTNSYRYFKNIFKGNRYYFENSIAKNNDTLIKVLDLWDDNLINDKMQGQITLKIDSTLLFETYTEVGIFSGINHFIVYDPNNKNGGLGIINSKVIDKEKLGNNWFYIIEERYYVD